jgi:hypothetical protein
MIIQRCGGGGGDLTSVECLFSITPLPEVNVAAENFCSACSTGLAGVARHVIDTHCKSSFPEFNDIL